MGYTKKRKTRKSRKSRRHRRGKRGSASGGGWFSSSGQKTSSNQLIEMDGPTSQKFDDLITQFVFTVDSLSEMDPSKGRTKELVFTMTKAEELFKTIKGDYADKYAFGNDRRKKLEDAILKYESFINYYNTHTYDTKLEKENSSLKQQIKNAIQKIDEVVELNNTSCKINNDLLENKKQLQEIFTVEGKTVDVNDTNVKLKDNQLVQGVASVI